MPPRGRRLVLRSMCPMTVQASNVGRSERVHDSRVAVRRDEHGTVATPPARDVAVAVSRHHDNSAS